jgi:hypothetical protein
MAKRKQRRTTREITWESAVQELESVLRSDSRREIIEKLLQARDFRESVRGLRTAMRFHRFRTGDQVLDLAGFVRKFDHFTRQEGVYVLHAWHHERHEFLGAITPVLMLDYCVGAAPGSGRLLLAGLLDYYWLHLLALLTMRAWDEGDVNLNLDRLNRLLADLQGEGGSGFRFVDDAETLLLLSISQYHPDEPAYLALLDKVQTLNGDHQLRVAKGMAAMLGGHLRWGVQDLYGQDYPRLRRDNVIDYPWLLFSLVVLLRAYEAPPEADPLDPERRQVIGCLINGLTADPEACLSKGQAFFPDDQGRLAECRTLLLRNRADLLVAFENHRPVGQTYSPLSFRFNFPHNVLVAMVISGLQEGVVWKPSLSDLLLGGRTAEESPESLARTLTAFSAQPERLDTRKRVQIVYDPLDGLRSFSRTMEILGAAN